MRMGQLKGRINRVKGIVNRLEEMIELSTTKRGSTRAAYEALAERGAVRIDERVLPKPRHQLSLHLEQDSSTNTR